MSFEKLAKNCLEAGYFKQVQIGELNQFNFADGKTVDYRVPKLGSQDLMVYLVTDKYLPILESGSSASKNHFTVRIQLDPSAPIYLAFDNMKRAIEGKIGTNVEVHYFNYVYLRCSEKMYVALNKCLETCDIPQVQLTIKARHIVFNKTTNKARLKYTLENMHISEHEEEPKKKKRRSTRKEVKKDIVDTAGDDAVQGPTDDPPLQDLGDLSGFFATVGSQQP